VSFTISNYLSNRHAAALLAKLADFCYSRLLSLEEVGIRDLEAIIVNQPEAIVTVMELLKDSKRHFSSRIVTVIEQYPASLIAIVFTGIKETLIFV